jgi:hypothetical protein
MTHGVEGAHPLNVEGDRAEHGQADIDQPDLHDQVGHPRHELAGLRREVQDEQLHAADA